MIRHIPVALLALCLGASPAAAQSAWKPVQKVVTYAITGSSGPELYASIGENGPKLGPTRAIAHTNFTLTWTRKYVPQGNACVLTVARPKLTITTTLPKPAKPLPEPARAHWQRFIDGITAHEAVHGAYIIDMVKKIEAATTGLTVEGDPGCKKIRDEVIVHVGSLFQAQRQQGRDFDRVEMSDGGNVHRLILALVNGD
ncbi:MAG: DUF922 domain-containing protein [Mesorhizobium sp.]|nr:DUF922 domain-containing protein [Mesorhizobium sp.]